MREGAALLEVLPGQAGRLAGNASYYAQVGEAVGQRMHWTPHSPSSGPVGSATAGGMSARPQSAGGAAAGAVRPVTARTWQAMGPPAEDRQRSMSIYNNDLYGNSGVAVPPVARPASPLYQPASARPSTPSAMPTPRSAERLQQQRIATPSRLQADGSQGSPRAGQRMQQVPVSTANVPAAPAAGAADRPSAAPSPTGGKARTSTISLSALKPAEVAAQQAAEPTAAEATTSPRAADGDATSPRPATSGTAASAGISLSVNSPIALNSPRVRQQVLRGFAGAVPAPAAGSPGRLSGTGAATPRPARGSSGSGRPSTPSFQPVAMARPATAMAGPVSGAADAPFTIKASYGRADAAALGSDVRSGAAAGQPNPLRSPYPQPPSTAPSKAAATGTADAAAAPAAPAPGSLASFGISSAAFIAAAPKNAAAAAAAAVEGPAGVEGKAALAPQALTQAAMLASTSLATKAELRRFLTTPGPADKPLQCKILRTGGGLLKGGPQYSLLVEQEGGRSGAFLLAARKRKGGPSGSTYVLSVDQHDVSRNSASYVGKLRSNFLGTEFVAYDSGAGGENGTPRCELGAVMYQTNVLGTKGPRKMTVLLPKLAPGGAKPLALAPMGEGDTLLGQYKSYALGNSVVLRNKPPRWNAAMSAYCLNFGGRVTQASVKNFQLVSVDNMDRTILQFGKVAGDAFTMDYSYPMTALQAFAICLSSFDSKLACE
ncbi:king tubby [Micractinium conductrix]|uniref:King tubby n=1 Tax=Micractinium conductrix TaxID=554055 RepID=A0A2P6VJ45_9CHLO|nr:king tubby [Micractinium conductrix]|eukprot:PSC74109.1 king tubby [Micractinium conductrix]